MGDRRRARRQGGVARALRRRGAASLLASWDSKAVLTLFSTLAHVQST